MIMSPFFDDMHALYDYEYSVGCITRIFMSCVFAIGVNITNYLVIGKTSPLTYQVVIPSSRWSMMFLLGARPSEDHSHPHPWLRHVQQNHRLPQCSRDHYRNGGGHLVH